MTLLSKFLLIGRAIYYTVFGEDDASLTGNFIFKSGPTYLSLQSVFCFLAYL